MRGQDPDGIRGGTHTFTGPNSDHRYHAQKAIAGAKNDPLLAQNLASLFNGQTTSALLNDGPAGAPNK